MIGLRALHFHVTDVDQVEANKRSPSGWSTHSGQVGRGRSSGLGISAMLVSVTAN